jgi:hypothetical protein
MKPGGKMTAMTTSMTIETAGQVGNLRGATATEKCEVCGSVALMHPS